MARNAKEIAGGGNSNMKAPELTPGAYPARVVQIVYLGVQEQRAYMGEQKKPVDEIRITYELSSEFMQDEDGNTLEDKPRWFSEDIPFYSLNADRAKSTARYKAIDPSDTADGDFAKLLGMACQVVLVNNPGKGKNAGRTFTNVQDVTPAPNLPGYSQPELVNPTFVFDPQDPELATADAFRSIPEFVRKKITAAIDYPGSALAQALGDNKAAANDPEPEAPAATPDEGDEMYA